MTVFHIILMAMGIVFVALFAYVRMAVRPIRTLKAQGPKRRRFQFSLRALLIAVVGLLVAWQVCVEPYRRQQQTMALIKELGGNCKTEPGLPAWMRDWFGANAFRNVVLIDVADCDDPEKYIGLVASLPRVETLIVGGQSFSDEHLSRLKSLVHLSGLVLDSTSVTDDAIGTLKQTLPTLVIRKSLRRTIVLITELGGSFKIEPGGPMWTRNRFGADDRQNIVLVNVADCDDPEKYLEQITSLPRLETLVVGGWSFTDEHLAYLKRLTTLNGLVLDSTDVSDDGIRALKRILPELAIHKSQRRQIVELTKLAWDVDTELCRKRPQLRRLVGDEYFMHAITVHGYWSTTLSNSDLKHLEGLTDIQGLDLYNTQISDAGLAHIKGLTNLQRLNLAGTRVTDAGLVHLRGMTNLQLLWLSRTKMTDIGLKHLKELTNIQRLWLSQNQISDAGLANLKGLMDLCELDVRFTPVSDAGLAHLKGLMNLNKLWLSGTQVTDAGVRELQTALPNCQIYKYP